MAERDALDSRVFLVGCPRSGTTLLQSLLAGHAEIASFPESHFFARGTPRRGWRKRLGLTTPRAREVYREFLRNVGAEGGTRSAPRLPIRRHFARRFVRLLDELTLERGKTRWVEKTPRHLHFVDEIEAKVPGVRFVHIVRNGVDVVASLYDVVNRYPEIWRGPRSIDWCIERWTGDVALTSQLVRRPNHHLVRYQELVESTCEVLGALGEFLGVEFDPADALRESRDVSDIVLDREPWKRGVREGVRKLPGRRFERVFAPAEQAYVASRVPPLEALLTAT